MNLKRALASEKTCLSLIIALVAGLAPILFCRADGARAQELQAPRPAIKVDLSELQDKGRRVSLDAGSGVELQLTNYKGGLPCQKIAVLDRGRVVRVLPQKAGHWFLSYSRLESSPATYWTITEWTGGAHCCLAMPILNSFR